jgi:hypothetical protein
MAYAKLSFLTTSTTTAQVLSDIKGLLTGAITAVADLQYADRTASQIRIGAFPGQGNWTLVSESVGHLALSSVCVTSSKTKYAIFQSYNGTSYGNTSLAAGKLYLTSAAGVSGTTYTKQTYYNYNGANGIAVNGTGGGQFYLHWGPNHVMIYKASLMYGVFEFPETTLTTSAGTVPVVAVFSSSFGAGYWGVDTGPTNNGTTGGTVVQCPNVYQPASGSTTGPMGLGTTSYIWIDNSLYNRSIIRTVNSSGEVAYPLIPMYTASYNKGFPAAFMSTYSGVYLTASAAASLGDTFNFGSDTYIYLPMTTAAGGCSLAVIYG